MGCVSSKSAKHATAVPVKKPVIEIIPSSPVPEERPVIEVLSPGGSNDDQTQAAFRSYISIDDGKEIVVQDLGSIKSHMSNRGESPLRSTRSSRKCTSPRCVHARTEASTEFVWQDSLKSPIKTSPRCHPNCSRMQSPSGASAYLSSKSSARSTVASPHLRSNASTMRTSGSVSSHGSKPSLQSPSTVTSRASLESTHLTHSASAQLTSPTFTKGVSLESSRMNDVESLASAKSLQSAVASVTSPGSLRTPLSSAPSATSSGSPRLVTQSNVTETTSTSPQATAPEASSTATGPVTEPAPVESNVQGSPKYGSPANNTRRAASKSKMRQPKDYSHLYTRTSRRAVFQPAVGSTSPVAGQRTVALAEPDLNPEHTPAAARDIVHQRRHSREKGGLTSPTTASLLKAVARGSPGSDTRTTVQPIRAGRNSVILRTFVEPPADAMPPWQRPLPKLAEPTAVGVAATPARSTTFYPKAVQQREAMDRLSRSIQVQSSTSDAVGASSRSSSVSTGRGTSRKFSATRSANKPPHIAFGRVVRRANRKTVPHRPIVGQTRIPVPHRSMLQGPHGIQSVHIVPPPPVPSADRSSAAKALDFDRESVETGDAADFAVVEEGEDLPVTAAVASPQALSPPLAPGALLDAEGSNVADTKPEITHLSSELTEPTAIGSIGTSAAATPAITSTVKDDGLLPSLAVTQSFVITPMPSVLNQSLRTTNLQPQLVTPSPFPEPPNVAPPATPRNAQVHSHVSEAGFDASAAANNAKPNVQEAGNVEDIQASN